VLGGAPRRGAFGANSTTLAITPLRPVSWPEYTCEARVYALADGGSVPPHPVDARTVVHGLLGLGGTKTPFPEHAVLRAVARGLAARYWLEPLSVRWWQPPQYWVPERTAQLLHEHPHTTLQQLLAACQELRPLVWQVLLARIEQALEHSTRLTESP
jgi:hypothetical protein